MLKITQPDKGQVGPRPGPLAGSFPRNLSLPVTPKLRTPLRAWIAAPKCRQHFWGPGGALGGGLWEGRARPGTWRGSINLSQEHSREFWVSSRAASGLGNPTGGDGGHQCGRDQGLVWKLYLCVELTVFRQRCPWTEEPGGLQSMGCKESEATEATQHARTGSFKVPGATSG